MTDIEKAIAFLEDLAESLAPEWRSKEGKHIGDDLSTEEMLIRTILTALQSQQPKTNFERWKRGLTLNKVSHKWQESLMLDCENCPASEFCRSHRDKFCLQSFKEWGEQDAD